VIEQRTIIDDNRHLDPSFSHPERELHISGNGALGEVVTRLVSITSDGAPPFDISDGEVNCILGFVHDGSIAAEPWHRLMGAWG